MKLLERYIAMNIIKATALITLIVTGVMFLLTLLGELKNVGQGDYGLISAFIYVLLRMPNLIYQFSPLLFLLGSILGLSMLYTHREIIVMRTSGFSVFQIFKSVLLTALLLILCIGFFGEWWGPKLSYKAEVRKENAENADQAVVTNKGIWFHVDNNFIHVQRIVNKQLLQGVTSYHFDDQHQLLASYFAKQLFYDGGQWMMKDVVETAIFNDHTKTANYATLPLEAKLNPNLFNIGLIDAEEMSLPKLAAFAGYLKQNGLQAREYEYNFWKRLIQPISSIVMILLAVPFVVGSLTNRTIGWRILVGLLAGFAFFILDAFLGELCIVYQLPAILAAAIAPFIFIILIFILSKPLRAR